MGDRFLKSVVAAVAVAGCAVCCVAGQRPGGNSFLEGLLAIPSVTSDLDANNEAVRYVRGWLDARGVCTAVVTNEAGRTALYASTVPGKEHDVVWRDHVIPTGLTGAPANNIIPDVAEMAFSCRVTSPDSAARIKEQVKKATGLEVIVPKKYRPPVLTDPENGYVKSLFAAMRAKWPERDIRLTRMSCATDATRYSHLALPTVIFGATGGGAHASVEWVSIKSVEDYAAMFTEYLRALPANGAALPPGKWHEPVRAGLQKVIDRKHGPNACYGQL